MAESVRHARLQDINFKKFKEKKGRKTANFTAIFFKHLKKGKLFPAETASFNKLNNPFINGLDDR